MTLLLYILRSHLLFILIGLLIRGAWCQETEARLRPGWPSRAVGMLETTGQYLLEGVITGHYKPPGWREYIMPDLLELPRTLAHEPQTHPRLITPVQISTARSRINRQPYREWYVKIRMAADRPEPLPNGRVYRLAKQAKACAFLFRLENTPFYREKAVSLLERIPEPPQIIDPEGGTAGQGWGDFLQSAAAVPDLCVAYDLLYDEIPLSVREETQRKILGVTGQLIDGFRITPRNNHVTVMAIAVATVALTFDSPQNYLPYRTQELFQIGMNHLSQSLGLISPDGGYGEGPYYARYILNYLSPFSVHLQNTTGIRLFENPHLDRMVTWVLNNEKGSGQFTQFDDAYATRFFFLPLIINQGLSGALWERFFRQPPLHISGHFREKILSGRPSVFPGFSSNMMEALAVYSPNSRMRGNAPFFPGTFYPDMGQVIFKDREVQPRFFVSLLGEQQRWFADVHEQIDPLSLELSARGEDWIIDGGYGTGTGDIDRPYFLSPRANSTILVDGVGTDPNPLIGDHPDSHMKYAFSTPNFAAAALSHTIGEVKLTRSLFYSGGNHLLLMDEMNGVDPHRFTVQLNYLGEFTDAGLGRWQLQKNGKQLTVHLLSENPSDWSLEESRGLATGQGGLFEHGVLGIRSPPQKQAALTSLWMASDATPQVTMDILPLVEGEGQWRQIRNFESGVTEDIVRNMSGEFSTTYWASNARLAWVKYHSPARPEAFLLVEGSKFRQGSLELRTTRPVTLYMERQGNSWAGYLHFDPRPGSLRLMMKGMEILPVRLNGMVRQVETSDGQITIEIAEPGRLAMGIGEPLIQIAQAAYPEPNFLRRLSTIPDLRQKATYWSDYEQNLFERQLIGGLLWGADAALRYRAAKWMGDSLIFHKTANALQGLLQYSYRSSLNGDGFLLPHRYGVNTEVGQTNWLIREEGDWRSSGPRIRDLWVRGFTGQETLISYRFKDLYSGYRSHQISMDWHRRAGVEGTFLRTDETELQDYRFFLRSARWRVYPGIVLQDREISIFRISGEYEKYGADFRANLLNDRPHYYEALYGKIGETLNWVTEGQQHSHTRFQTYRAALSGKLTTTHFFLADVSAKNNPDWRMASAGFRLNGTYKTYQYFQHLRYLSSEWFWSGAVFSSGTQGYWSLDVQLDNWRFGQHSDANLIFSHRLSNDLLWNTRLNYAYSRKTGDFGVTADQQWSVPVSQPVVLHPVWQIRFGREVEWERVGWGVSLQQPWPVYLQIMQLRTDYPFFYRLDSEVPVSLSAKNRLHISGNFLWQENQLQYAEVGVRQSGAQLVSPGLYYRYLRPGERRLEGFLEWRW